MYFKSVFQSHCHQRKLIQILVHIHLVHRINLVGTSLRNLQLGTSLQLNLGVTLEHSTSQLLVRTSLIQANFLVNIVDSQIRISSSLIIANFRLVLSISLLQVGTSHHNQGTSRHSLATSQINNSTSLAKVNSRTFSLVLHSRISLIIPLTNQIQVFYIQILLQHHIQVSHRKIHCILRVHAQVLTQTSRT